MVIFPKNWYFPNPSCNKVTQSSSLKNCLSTFNFFPVSFFTHLLCISRKNRTQVKKILTLSHRLKWNTISQIQKMHFIFLSTLVLKDQSKWRANKNEQGERNIMLIRMFVLKVINNERKILTCHEINDRIAEQILLVIT